MYMKIYFLEKCCFKPNQNFSNVLPNPNLFFTFCFLTFLRIYARDLISFSYLSH